MCCIWGFIYIIDSLHCYFTITVKKNNNTIGLDKHKCCKFTRIAYFRCVGGDAIFKTFKSNSTRNFLVLKFAMLFIKKACKIKCGYMNFFFFFFKFSNDQNLFYISLWLIYSFKLFLFSALYEFKVILFK